jgi:acyl-CoA synthetase (NDP forming)/GNAT superfamily N-acetyltransferase
MTAAVDVLLADGRIATVRPVLATDRAALVSLHEDVSDDNARLRFFGVNPLAGRRYAEHLGATAGTDAVLALVAVLDAELVGVASAEVLRGDRAEVSFLVSDAAHGLGIGTLLLEHLAAHARDRGISDLTAEVLVENSTMARVLTDCGFDLERMSEHGVVTFRLSTTATERAVAAADAREARAESRSLAPLLRPASVAVVGVRRAGGGVGRAVLEEVIGGGFTGDVYVVHPGGLHVADVRVVPDLASIGRPVDLVVVTVPSPQVPDVVRAAAQAGARAAVIMTSGFAEAGAEGRRVQGELVAVARRHSMRLVGPNCLGIVSTGPGVRLNATFARGLPGPGGLAVASQSGGVGIALLDLAQQSGVGLASFVSLGNKADVSGNDLLAAWLEDPDVTAAALYLESFGNARKFARLARRFAQRKPLLAIVGGRSSGGRRAGSSHTAAAATPEVGVDALFAQSGVIGCRGLDELADTARLLTTQPLPTGPRLAVVGNAGGLGVLAADAANHFGLVLPELGQQIGDRLSGDAARVAAVDNPVDLGATATSDALLAATRAALSSDEVDAVLTVVAGTKVTDASGFLAVLAGSRGDTGAKPLLLVAVGDVEVPESRGGFARFRSVEDATRALGHAAAYAAWLASPSGPGEPAVPALASRARALAAELLPGTSDGWVRVDRSRQLLSLYGVDVLESRVERGLPRLLEAAHQLGYPVVLKAGDPAIVHKTERGLVRPGLTAPEDVVAAAGDLALKLGVAEPHLLVQAEASPGVEMAVGVVRDDSFGPLVMVATGGVASDVWDDRVFLLPPFTLADAGRAIRRLRAWPLLAGFRGARGVDVPALEALVHAVGLLSRDVPAIAELDLNPVIMTSAGATCVDLKVRLRATDRDDDGVPRRLRTAT